MTALIYTGDLPPPSTRNNHRKHSCCGHRNTWVRTKPPDTPTVTMTTRCRRLYSNNIGPNHHRKYRPCTASDHNTVYCAVLLFVCVALHIPSCEAQTRNRTFPTLFNVAKERPIRTIPADGTCGVPARNAYCESSTSQTSIQQCIQDFCEQTCSSRDFLPDFANLLIATSAGFSQCVGADTVNIRPGSEVSAGDYATTITGAGPTCYLTPAVTPVVGDIGSFTITAWIWIDFDGQGALVEKESPSGSIILQVLVGPSGVNVTYATQSGPATAIFAHPIQKQNWTHLAVQVYDKTVSIFLNGLGPNFTASATDFLPEPISDSPGSFRLGQSFDGSNQYLGKIQDVRFYSTTLSNREVQEVYTGTLPELRVQSKCRCPAATPRIKPQDIRYCIPNGVPDNAADARLRISEFSHPLEFANDPDGNSVWISKFFLQGTSLSIEVDLGDEFQVFFVVLRFYSPLPKAVEIERFVHKTQTWAPWQYFADDCVQYFNLTNNGPLPAADSINCLRMGGTNIPSPYSSGNITFNVLATAPVARPEDFFQSKTLQEFVLASKVRVTFRDHFHITNIRHYYYALYDFGVNGRCDCNGHAETCTVNPLPYKCQCTPESHTQGDRCSECQPLYNMKPFRKGDQSNPYNCVLCECYGHADSCVYNATLDPFPSSWTEGGGGVCVNCKHFTEGRSCDTCINGYYRPTGKSLFAVDVCSPCSCNAAGTVDGSNICQKVGGQCDCKVNVTGRACGTCAPGTYNLQASNLAGCTPCDCMYEGTVNGDITCNQTTGNCNCKQNVIGRRCDQCEFGFFRLEEDNVFGCTACDCNPEGSRSLYCNPVDGQCLCKDHVRGVKCDQCISGYFNFSVGCVPCDCNPLGTQEGSTCDSTTGQCQCKANTVGRDCGQCRPGTYSLGSSPEKGCQDCTCDTRGTIDGLMLCNATGHCNCKANVTGQRCNQCVDNTWGLSADNEFGCQPCDCDPSGTHGDQQLRCNQETGDCTCLPFRVGRRCDDCQAGYYVDSNPGGGCLNCSCNAAMTQPSTTCDSKTGQCQCRTDVGGTGRDCSTCLDGYYLSGFSIYNHPICKAQNLRPCNLCVPCGCLPAGSISLKCDSGGVCLDCKEFVEGDKCNVCKPDSSMLEASNPYGCSKTPSQQPAPVHQPLSPTSIALRWDEPDDPNGVIQVYRLYRNNTLIYLTHNTSGEARAYTDMGLEPYTLYSYRVEAENAHGTATSPSVFFRTNPGRPSAVLDFSVTEIGVFSARFRWERPLDVNGPDLKYQLVSRIGNQSVVEWEGRETEVLLESLRPYRSYNMTVRACTVGGCSESDVLTFITKAAPPTGMQAPVIRPLSSTELSVSWQPPLEPNGVIIFYELWIRGMPGPDGVRDPVQSRIFHAGGMYDPLNLGSSALKPPETAFNITNLRPFTLYEFQVLAENSAGKAASPWTSGRTLETVPLSMPAPTVIGLSSTQLNVSWQAPTASEARGNITVYRLYQNMVRNLTADIYASPTYWKLLLDVGGSVFSHIVVGLKPYMEYTFKLEACNTIGCVNSTASTGRTLSAAPQGMEAPVVDGFNSTAMEIKWKPPTSPNGPTPLYKVQKTNIAISYPASVVRGTRFPGGGYYTFPADTIPQNVDFTGVRFEFRLQAKKGLLMFAGSENMDEFIAVVFTNGRPRFMYDTSGCPVDLEINVNLTENANLTSLDDREVHTVEARRLGYNSSLVVDGIYRGVGDSCRGWNGISTYTDEGLSYADSKWHSLMAFRNGSKAVIYVDDFFGDGAPDSRDCVRTKRIIGPTTNLYVGGVPSTLEYKRGVVSNYPLYQTWNAHFQGCIHKVEILTQVYPEEVWTELKWNEAEYYELAFLNWQGCPLNLEGGIHFMGKGYARYARCNFDKKRCMLDSPDFDIVFRMRTWLHTGQLFFVHGGSGIYMLIYLYEGNMSFIFSDGSVTTNVTYSNPQHTLCDGRWRTFTFSKTGQQGKILVDGSSEAVSGNPVQYMQISVTSEIFLGGIKPDSDMATFLTTNGIFTPTEGFGGCITGLNIGGVDDEFAETRDLVNVNLDGCPPFYLPSDTCQQGLVTQVYEGRDTQAYDTGLLPYTDYIYRVEAANDVGQTTSPWGYGRTREGKPVGVGGPTSVRAISGYMVEVTWDEPQSTSGLLTKTIILAYNLDRPELEPLQTEIDNVDVEGTNITDVTPNTNYEIRISACTSGGCTESDEGTQVLTPVEAPEEVASPTAIPTATSLLVMWGPPAKPNGDITGYFLYMDGVQVYAGGQQQYNVSNLQVYTAYQFYVRACTIAGCTDGPSISLATAQLPPTYVKPPTLEVRDTRSIEVNWEKPEKLNGVLERYLVYVSTVEGQRGDLRHNTTEFYPQHLLTNLTAGTTYFISVGACTGGGCTVSNASRATTGESSPEGVSPPVVTSPSPSQLTVIWDEPEFPNGVITSYALFQNGLIVTEGLARVYQVDGLLPYSLHTFRVRACTAKGCGLSAQVEARTQEAPPKGLVVAQATVVNARTVRVTWTRPEEANGLLYFHVFFEGLFYVDRENWNYTTVFGRRSLLRETVSYTPFEINSLIPMSEYRIQVNASNTKGFILSNIVRIALYPGSPDGMKPPTVVSDTPNSLQVSWEPVGRVNAEEDVAYTVQFRQQEGDVITDDFGPTTTFSYRKAGLTPFTSYQFRIVAQNSYGRTFSPWVEATTNEDKPAGVSPPRFASVQERSVNLTWQEPVAPNGILTEYRLYLNGTVIETIPANQTDFVVEQLTPYQVYSFQVEACTSAGCTKSAPSSSIRTMEAVPDGIAPPVLKALTPASIEVRWSGPTGPNGIITEYILDRKVASGTAVTVVARFTPSDPKSYVDESAVLSPYTTYSYRIRIVNGAGVGEGPWANVTTLSSRPGGVLPPSLRVLGPTAMNVSWSAPAQPNGLIEYYVIRWGDSQLEIRNYSTLTVNLTDLVPYTDYSVTVTACTNGGCTQSLPSNARTDAAIPSGQAPPSVLAVSQSAVSVTWNPPTRPSGPGIRYELARKKVRQPLNPTVGDVGIWQSVFQGTSLQYEDRSLSMFTTYVYRVTVFNAIGQMTSNESVEVTTFGGYPRQAARVSAVAISHVEIRVNWTLPAPVDLQGDVQSLTLAASSYQGNITVSPQVDATNYTLGGLTANTDYNIYLTVTIFGGSSITSEPVTVRTLDGAPEGVAAPVLAIVSDTALRVSWTAPAQPNGDITAYNIIVNGKTTPTHSTQPGSLVITDLQPYTVYEVQTEACTVFGCTRSASTFGTTLEALPLGVAAPTFTAVTPTSLTVEWEAPSRPNGIILRYDLWRKTLRNCSQVPLPEVNPEMTKCTYLECSVFENVCGTSCYTGAKVCCNGVLHDIRTGYGCCGTSYIPKPVQNAVCCAGKFYAPQPNFRCCGTRYTEVNSGEVCCASPTEDRVSVSLGDSCCAGVPYSSFGSQICCGGVLVGRYGRRCCGGEVVSDRSVCCGNETVGQVYLPQTGYTCCGQVYSPTDTSLCCTSDTGHTKVHYYNSSLAKQASNEICCGLEKISAGLSCCNYVGYNAVTQTCADRSTQVSGCGTGVVCPISQLRSALCNRCDFNSATTICGTIPGHYIPPTPAPSPNASCSTEEERIYSGLDLSYNETSLEPYIQYEYSVRVVNSAGSTSSPFASVRTLQAPPASVSPPVTRVDPEQLYIIYLTWSPPEQPNGEIIRYILQRNGVELFRGLATEFTDDRNVLPYRLYTYVLTACTEAGCTDSPSARVATAQGIPEDLLPPVVSVEGPNSLLVRVQAPGSPNGEILGYTVHISGRPQVYRVLTPQDVRVEGLTPYTEYTINVEVCTRAGCANTPNVTVTTAEAAPEGLDAPKVVVRNASSVDVYWKVPRVMNGQLQSYLVLQQDFFGTSEEVYRGVELSATIQDLVPGRTYSFLVEAQTNGGSVRSSATRITLPTRTPANVPPPNVIVLSATQIFVSWPAVISPGDSVEQYRVLVNVGQDSEVILGVGLSQNVTVDDLKPFTFYEVRLQACLSGVPNGCGTSDSVVKRTFEAPPSGQGAPTLTALASDAVLIEWEPPADSNGVITAYRIYRRAANATEVGLLINQVSSVNSFVHSGQDLMPYTVYEYGVMALNSQGQTNIAYSSVRTLQAPPLGLPPPLVNATGAYSIFLAWSPPSQPNGVISQYNIYYRLSAADKMTEDSVTVVGNTTSTTISGLEPFSDYVVRLEAVNGAGKIASVQVPVSTRQASPSGLSDFQVEKISTGTAVILRWDPPAKPNGIITSYRVYETTDLENPIYSGVGRVFEFRRLLPFTEYFVQQEACTSAGCTRGKVQTVQTAEIAPQSQARPTMGMVNATHVLIRWSQPLVPNGRISQYEVYRRQTAQRRKRQAVDTGSPGQVVYRTTDTDAEEYEYLDSNLEPYTEYEYKIRASNSQGYTDSPWQAVQTSQAAPEGVAPPKVTLLPTEVGAVNVSWTAPSKPNGVLQGYQLQRNASIPFSLLPDGPLHYVDQNLAAYTTYSYTITACSGGGCTVSEPAIIRTREAAPLSVSPPDLTAANSTAILATWTEPAVSNGEISLYQLAMDGVVVYEGKDTEFTVSGLTPYQEYFFALTACTQGGCTTSSTVSGRPDDAPPMDLDPPLLRVMGSTAIEVSWSPPKNPNGVISSYDVRRDGQLVFTDSITLTGTIRTAYTDYNLQPGEQYTYTIIARNRKGSVESAPSVAQTYASSPSGLGKPALTPLSSTSIRATWNPPVQPNGQITNYTLYRGNSIVYSGGPDQLQYDVPGLNFFTEYTFRLQACTSRGCELSEPETAKTLEAPPEQLASPSLTALANENGAHKGVLVAWRAPVKPNGVIQYYQVQRRIVEVTNAGFTYGDVILVYNGTNLEATDSDPRLRPYQSYEYMVIAVNGAGKTSSQWASVTTKQAPPTSVDPPIVVASAATTITVTITPPEEPNGVIRLYNILVNNSIQATGLTLQQTVGQSVPLNPFTTYSLQVQACTSGGCTNSAGVIAKTTTAKPSGLDPVRIVNFNSTAIWLSWAYPERPNGEIVRFVVYQRTACPPTQQPFTQSCSPGESKQVYEGTQLSTTVGGLAPYTAYEFLLQAENAEGGVDFPQWVRGVTAAAAPKYVQPPTLTKNSSLAVIDWSKSFVLNGQLQKYTLLVDTEVVTEGTATVHNVERESKNQEFVFVVRAVTDSGQAETPPLVFDPNASNNIGSTTESVSPDSVVGAKAFYEEVWFIIVIIIVGLLILFIIVAICLRRSSPKEPYIRERMPLEESNRKLPRDLYVIDANDGSIIDGALPPSAMSGRNNPYRVSSYGVINPAFANDRDDHLQTLSIGRLSKSSLDDADDITWDRNFDSGLFDDDDVDSLDGPAYSYTREQTVFTDTHL